MSASLSIDGILGKTLFLATQYESDDGRARWRPFVVSGAGWRVVSFDPARRGVLTVEHTQARTRSQIPWLIVKRAIVRGQCVVE